MPIVQGPGPGNPLGRLKFVFPNAHDVYMHDTPDKDLFSASVRTFSHGCIRVHNPERLAEVILGETRGWTPADVKRQLAIKDTLQVDLLQQVQVHNTYFTIVADEAGGLRSLNDVYGHDKRIGDALAGKPIDQIAANDPALAQLRENQELAKRGAGGEAKRSRYSRYADSRYSAPPGRASETDNPNPSRCSTCSRLSKNCRLRAAADGGLRPSPDRASWQFATGKGY